MSSLVALEEAAAQLSSSTYLKFIMSFHIVASSVGILALGHMEWNRKTRKLLAHKSLLRLVDMHSFWTFLLCLSTVVHNFATLHAHLTMRSPSDILVTASTCAIRRAPIMLAIHGSIFSQLTMAVERYRASQNLKNYEHTDGSSGHRLNAMHVTAVLLFSFVNLLYYYDSGWTATHCTLARFNGGIYYIFMAFLIFACELTTIVTFNRLLARNIRLRDNVDATLSLSERYQLTENVRMLKLINPIIWSHTSFGMVGSGLFLVFKFIYPSPVMNPLVEESINLMYLQGICIPIIFMFRFREERMHHNEVVSVNATKGAAFASHHYKAITERW